MIVDSYIETMPILELLVEEFSFIFMLGSFLEDMNARNDARNVLRND